MKKLKLPLAGFLAVLLMIAPGCATKILWEKTDPNERVWISVSEISEKQLIDKNIHYYKTNEKPGPGFLIPKSSARRLGDYTIRMLATPATVVVDAATVVMIVAVAVYAFTPDDALKAIDHLMSK